MKLTELFTGQMNVYNKEVYTQKAYSGPEWLARLCLTFELKLVIDDFSLNYSVTDEDKNWSQLAR